MLQDNLSVLALMQTFYILNLWIVDITFRKMQIETNLLPLNVSSS